MELSLRRRRKRRLRGGPVLLTVASDLASSDGLRLGEDVRQVSFAAPGVLAVVPVAGLPLAGPDGVAKWLLGSAGAASLTVAVSTTGVLARRADQVQMAA